MGNPRNALKAVSKRLGLFRNSVTGTNAGQVSTRIPVLVDDIVLNILALCNISTVLSVSQVWLQFHGLFKKAKANSAWCDCDQLAIRLVNTFISLYSTLRRSGWSFFLAYTLWGSSILSRGRVFRGSQSTHSSI
jgi:hypothetical protein